MNAKLQSPETWRLKRLGGILATTFLTTGSATAIELNTGNPDLSVRWDNTVRYNVAQRIEERNSKIGNSPLADEGTYSFDKGELVANRLDLLTELDVVYRRDLGFRLSAAGWYDAAYGDRSHRNPASTAAFNNPSYRNGQYSPYIKRYYQGPSGEILDAFVFGNFDLGSVPLKLKAGRHTVFWGESLFLGGALHGVSYAQMPLDLQKGFATPGVEAKELFRPLGQVSAQVQATDTLSLAGQYFFQWESYRFPEGGTYLGPADFVFNGPEGQFQGGVYFRRNEPIKPRQQGEFGLSARWSPEILDGTVGLYYRNYADKIPQVLLTGHPLLGQAPTYSLVYADDIDLFGLSFSKSIAGVSFGTELSYRRNTPLVTRVFGNVAATGVPPRGETSGARGDTVHALVNALGSISRTPLFHSASWAAELTWSRWEKVRSGANLFQAVGYTGGCPTNDKWDGCVTKTYVGGALSFTPVWFQVLPGVDISLPLTYAVGLKGNAATTFGGNEGLGNYSIGIGADIDQKYRIDLKYIEYFGKLRDNGTAVTSQNGLTSLLSDRGFVSLTFKTSF